MKTVQFFKNLAAPVPGSLSLGRVARPPLAFVVLILIAVTSFAAAQTATPASNVLGFAPLSVGATSQTMTASFTVTSSGGAFTPTARLHYGLSYALGAVTCTGSGTETCTVPVSFKPLYPGARRDAIFLMNGSTRLATMLLSGVGQGPLSLMTPGLLTTPHTDGNLYFYQSVVDDNGTAYVISSAQSVVTSVTAAGVATQLPIPVDRPLSIAIDGAGVLYVSDSSSRPYSGAPILDIKTYDTVTGVQNSMTNAGNGLIDALALGDDGQLYETDQQTIFEVSEFGGAAKTFPISPDPLQTTGFVVDSNENLFLGGDYGQNELKPDGTQTQINQMQANYGYVVDAADTLYVGRFSRTQNVGMLPASNGWSAGIGPELAPNTSPLGLGIGGDGTLWVGNSNSFEKVDRTQGAFTFDATNPGQAADPQTAYLYNGGNQPLTLTSFALSGDPAYTLSSPASGLACTFGLSIPVGGLCAVVVNFTAPGRGGVFNGTLTFTTNSLNTATNQVVALNDSVTGPYLVPSPASLAFGNQPANTTSAPMSVTLTNNGYNASGSITSTKSSNGAFTAGEIPPACNSIAVGSSCVVGVTFSPAASGSTSGALTFSGNAPDAVVNVTGGVGAAVVISPGAIPQGITGIGYAGVAFSATGGSGSLTLSGSGTLPQGMSLTPDNQYLILNGIPRIAGTYPFSILAKDNASGATTSQNYSLVITIPLLDPGSFAPATAGKPYSQVFAIDGNPFGYTLTMTGADGLPPGLTYSASGETVTISGTPTPVNSSVSFYGPFTFTLTDRYGNTATRGPIGMTVEPEPAVTFAVTSTPAAPTYNDSVTVTFALTGSLSAVPTGTLSVSIDGYSAQSYPITAGAATVVVGRQAAGRHTLTYTYSGDASYVASTPQIYSYSVAVPPYSVAGSQAPIASISGANVAIDSKDNVYYPNFNDNNIYKIDTQGNTTLVPTTGLSSPQGMKFDLSDNLYICDAQNSRIVMLTPAGVQTVLPVTGLDQPRFLAFDPSYQKLYISDRYAGILVYNLVNKTTTVYATNLFRPEGIAVDAQENVYYGDGGTLTKNKAAFSTSVGEPDGLLFDRAGNLYIVGYGLYRMDPSGVVTQMADEAPNDIAIDSHGNFYYPSHNGQHMLAYTPGPSVWGGRNAAFVGGRVQNQSANGLRAYYATPNGVTLSSVAISSAGSPYGGTTSPSCFTSTLCGIDLSLGAFLPGPQPGFGVAAFSDGTKTTTPLYGTGVQVEIGFSPGMTSQITTGVTSYGGAANDLNGNVYVSDSTANKVYKVAAGVTTPVAFTGLNAPTQLAVDGTGSIYVLDSGTQRVLKLDSTGKQSVAFDLTQQAPFLNDSLTTVKAFAVDGATNLYVAGSGVVDGVLIEFVGANGRSTPTPHRRTCHRSWPSIAMARCTQPTRRVVS